MYCLHDTLVFLVSVNNRKRCVCCGCCDFDASTNSRTDIFSSCAGPKCNFWRTSFMVYWVRQAKSYSVAFVVSPYPLGCRCDTIYCIPRIVAMVYNNVCRMPAVVIKIREIPSGIQNTAAFPSFISHLSVASGAEYSEISASIVFPGYWQNSSVSWYKVGCGVSPITVHSEALTISKHFHWIVTSECCIEL